VQEAAPSPQSLVPGLAQVQVQESATVQVLEWAAAKKAEPSQQSLIPA
jgi:hypothetical protein